MTRRCNNIGTIGGIKMKLETIHSGSEGENMESKPRTVGGYLKWLKGEHDVAVAMLDKTYYYSVAYKVKRDFETSDFWVQLVGNLGRYDQEYLLKTGYPLFIPRFRPELLIKSFESFLQKTYRKNVLENKFWPNEPEGGWIMPSNWFSRINDIVRTLFVVKYFDGVDFIISKIGSLCEQQNMESRVFLEAREEGYYAAHLYAKRHFEIPKITWDTVRIILSIEIQVTTQLQEVIRKLLHKYYEKKRKLVKIPVAKWQWDYKCDEFCVNYLGHILHYVEGMIMDVREKQKEEMP